MVFDPSFVPFAKAGKVLAAFVDQPARLPDLPNTPTTTEVGLDLKGFRARSWFGLFAPKGTPEPILRRLSDTAAKVAARPDMKEKLLLVAQTVEHQSHVDFARQVREDQVYFARLLKDLDIKLE
jgi:tripartite-type tricarboxylate transporter receptor subunit TctC